MRTINRPAAPAAPVRGVSLEEAAAALAAIQQFVVSHSPEASPNLYANVDCWKRVALLDGVTRDPRDRIGWRQ